MPLPETGKSPPNRMLASVVEAEDVVQDAWLRWDRADQDAVSKDGAFIRKMGIPITDLESDVLWSHGLDLVID